MDTKAKTYSAIDIMKFVGALLVVILHVTTYALKDLAVNGAPPTGAESPLILFVLPLCYCFLRIAVPFFFVSSSFFLFKKIKSNPENKKVILRNYVKRILLLFLFWFIVSLPITINSQILNSGLVWYESILLLLKNIIFNGAFDGAWYLVASIFAVLIVYYLPKRWEMGISIVLYVFACFSSSYYGLFSGTGFQTFIDGIGWLTPMYQSFFNGMIFVVMGRYFAERNSETAKKYNVLLIFSAVLMYAELLTLNYFALPFATDCYITLVIFTYFLFNRLLQSKLQPKPIYQKMRNCSTFIYLSHFVVLYCFYYFVYANNWRIFMDNYLVVVLVYIFTVAICIGLFMLANKLSKKKHFAWLKYSF